MLRKTKTVTTVKEITKTVNCGIPRNSSVYREVLTDLFAVVPKNKFVSTGTKRKQAKFEEEEKTTNE